MEMHRAFLLRSFKVAAFRVKKCAPLRLSCRVQCAMKWRRKIALFRSNGLYYLLRFIISLEEEC